jgi:hypothetical protein
MSSPTAQNVFLCRRPGAVNSKVVRINQLDLTIAIVAFSAHARLSVA